MPKCATVEKCSGKRAVKEGEFEESLLADAKIQVSEALCSKIKLRNTHAEVLETGNSAKEHSGEEI